MTLQNILLFARYIKYILVVFMSNFYSNWFIPLCHWWKNLDLFVEALLLTMILSECWHVYSAVEVFHPYENLNCTIYDICKRCLLVNKCIEKNKKLWKRESTNIMNKESNWQYHWQRVCSKFGKSCKMKIELAKYIETEISWVRVGFCQKESL